MNKTKVLFPSVTRSRFIILIIRRGSFRSRLSSTLFRGTVEWNRVMAKTPHEHRGSVVTSDIIEGVIAPPVGIYFHGICRVTGPRRGLYGAWEN